MGRHLDRAKAYVGRDVSGLLEGGRYSLVHTRSLEFDDLRPYVPGDDVRDIDWKATARSGNVLIKRFVSEKHHKILVVADAGRNTAGLSPSGEVKREVAANVIGALGLITLPRSDEIGMVFGDGRGCVDIRLRRGETHLEYMLQRYLDHACDHPGRSDVVTQLRWVAEHYRHRHLVVVVSDEPEVDDRLDELLTRLAARHDVMWAMTVDHPAIAGPDDPMDADVVGYDVADGATVLGRTDLGRDVIAAYEEAERARREALYESMTAHAVPYALIAGSRGIRRGLIGMTGVLARAG
ncbi:DUF58 domain-containing protein [Mycolicibacterium sediminis]|uniref:DUF58 domain-containing protein n=1 Tax=Mycolicibacterium sediminis TaxID=1286180 RepID=A0A7I7QK10_9MYCO|nr:DUF58 domain-containing protein [Mycolicibacterium sediminis]BBY26709.1 hypothetical protein MSEDJ_08050 [Mycolicibacterium sediminis]